MEVYCKLCGCEMENEGMTDDGTIVWYCLGCDVIAMEDQNSRSLKWFKRID